MGKDERRISSRLSAAILGRRESKSEKKKELVWKKSVFISNIDYFQQTGDTWSSCCFLFDHVVARTRRHIGAFTFAMDNKCFKSTAEALTKKIALSTISQVLSLKFVMRICTINFVFRHQLSSTLWLLDYFLPSLNFMPRFLKFQEYWNTYFPDIEPWIVHKKNRVYPSLTNKSMKK